MISLIAGLALLTTSPDQPRDVQMWVSKDIAPYSKIRIQINTRNVPAVKMSAYRIDGVEWFRHSLQERKRPETGRPVQQWVTTVANARQRFAPNQTDRYYSRQINLPPMKPGVYLMATAGGGKEAWSVVNVTNLAIIQKRSPKRTLVWVTDAKTGRVLQGAKVTDYDRRGVVVTNATTNKDGVALFPIKPSQDTIVVTRGGDLAAVGSAGYDPDGQLKAHFQTDRPIYRPGQKVFFKAIMRRTLGQGYRALANETVGYEVRDSKDNPLDQGQLKANAIGTVAGEFEIPSEAATGPYSLILASGNDRAYNTFTVAEYRKPEYKVDVKPLQKRYLAGEELRFEVNAQYYFGSPVPQAQVTYQVRSSPMSFYYGDDAGQPFYGGDGNLYPRDTYASQPFVAADTVYTGNDGKVTIVVKTAKDLPDSTYSISLTVQDGSRRQVSGAGSVPVYAAALRLGLRSDVSFAPLGHLFPVEVRAADLDGNPSPAEVTIRVFRYVWVEKKGEYEEKEVASTDLRVPATGKAVVQLPAKVEGDLTVRAIAKDRTGRIAKTEMGFYVAGPFTKADKRIVEPQINLRLDRRTYAPGQQASAFVSTNVPTRPILLTLEGQDIWQYKVVTGSSLWNVPTTTAMSPNAFVDAVQWTRNLQPLMANAILPVPDPMRKLTLTVKPDRTEYRPGDPARVQVIAKDAKGRPVSAEVALSVVDEAIYALSGDNTADLYTTYWGQRQNWVQTQMSAPEEVSGGAYQRVNSVAPVRQRFEDTAFWNAFVQTGPSGTATVNFEMPGNLTSWRMTARGVTAETLVGMDTEKVQANRQVQLRLATPRQIVQGDRLTLIGTVDNRTPNDHEFEATLSVDGLSLSTPGSQKVKVPAKNQAKVEWILSADTLPAKGTAILNGQVVCLDSPDIDRSDALRLSLKVAPKGVQERLLTGGSLKQSRELSFALPTERIEPASVVKVTVRAGLQPLLSSASDVVLRSTRYSSVAAANQLMVAALTGAKPTDDVVRESIAMLSRTQSHDGWGWWEGAPTDPVITARVLQALSVAKQKGLPVYDKMLQSAKEAAVGKYNQTNLWEHRALLASALAQSGDNRGWDEIDEVLARGQQLSPYARLRLAEALIPRDVMKSAEVLQSVVKDASEGPTSAFVPVGDGVGWTASEYETTAEALLLLSLIQRQDPLDTRLARWLAEPERRWRSLDENTALVRALSLYLSIHPDAQRIGNIELAVNGTNVETQRAKVGEAVVATVPASLLVGDNTLSIQRDGDGEAFVEIEAHYFVPATGENAHGVRVLRRFEVRNAAGVWEELKRTVNPSEPVRVTVVAWGDDIADAMRISEPIPSSFEFVDADITPYGRQEVRDAAVVHYLLNNGAPQTFRYYLRAESEGQLTALPATGEYLRRPTTKGQSSQEAIEVRG